MRQALAPQDLGFELRKSDETSLFKWFLASFLSGNRIAQATAARTWRVLVQTHGIDSPRALCACSHAALVRMLGEGGYRRYDQSTAQRLAALCRGLIDDYDGRILGIAEAATDRADFERRLLAFKGVGPVTLRIFLDEAGALLFDGG